jgi:hypothetical protein
MTSTFILMFNYYSFSCFKRSFNFLMFINIYKQKKEEFGFFKHSGNNVNTNQYSTRFQT